MAITYVNFDEEVYNSGSPVGSRTKSINIGTRTNGLLIVSVAIFNSSAGVTPDITGITYGGTALSKARDHTYSSGDLDYISEIWYLANPAAGANDRVVTFAAANVGVCQIVTSWYDGAAQTSVLDNVNSGEGTTDPSVAVTPTMDGCLIVSHYCSEANAVLSVGSGETLIVDEDWTSQTAGASYVIQTTAGAQTMDWAGVNSAWAMSVAAFRPAAGPSPSVNDTAGASETVAISAMLSAGINTAETITSVDTPTAQLIAEPITADNVGIAESVSAEVGAEPAREASAADNVGVADQLGTYYPDTVWVNELVAVSIAAMADLEASASEALSLAESSTAELLAEVSASDTIGTAESLAVETGAPQVSVNNTIGTAESTAAEVGIQASAGETIGTAESTAAEITTQVSASEMIGAGEATAAEVGVSQVSVSDSAGLSESTAANVVEAGVLTVSVSDAVIAAESTNALVGPPQVGVSDSIGSSENVAVAVGLPQVSVTDLVGLSEAANAEIVAAAALGASASDTATVTESTELSVLEAGQINIAAGDTVTVAESASVETGSPQAGTSDTIGVSESVAVTISTAISVFETIGTAESCTAAFEFVITTSEMISTSDTSWAMVGASQVSVFETIGIIESSTAGIFGGIPGRVRSTIERIDGVGASIVKVGGVLVEIARRYGISSEDNNNG